MTNFPGYCATWNAEEGYFTTPRKEKNIGTYDKVSGYWSITLRMKDGVRKTEKFHRALWQAYHDKFVPAKHHIMHLDENRSRNVISNLKCGTASENRRMITFRRKPVRKAWKIPVKCKSEDGQVFEFPSITACANALHLCKATIGKVLDNRPQNRYYKNAVDPKGKKFCFVVCNFVWNFES